MRQFNLAASALSLGVGSAFADRIVINSHGQVISDPACSKGNAGG
jgi:hypothetical protein